MKSVFNCSLIVGLLAYTNAISYTPKIDTNIGSIVGIQQTFKEGKANFFLGIPYAKPPLKNLRFKKSIPYIGDDNLIVANNLKPICIEPRIEIIAANNPYGQSEDCLYLNIVQNANPSKSGKKSPILVITELLGNNFLTDESFEVIELLYTLPLRHDIIIVYISSRKNMFGFAYSKNHPELKGNYGLWDQNLALKWIKDNIQFFGGNPDAVTLLGLGPGSADVGAHIVSPFAKGLFERAIMLERPLFAIGEDANGRTSLSTNIVADRVGCGEVEDVLSCLQMVPAKRIIDALPHRYEPFRPVFKSEYIPNSMNDTIIRSYFNDVDLLFGFDRDPGSNLVAISASQVWTYDQFTEDEAVKIISKIFKRDYSKYIAQKYIASKSDTHDDLEIRKGISDLFTDIVFACPLIEFGYRFALKQKKGQTYGLINHYSPTTAAYGICNNDPRFGVCERNFGSLVFGAPFAFPNKFNNTDRKASTFAMELISNFVYSGSPSKGKWPSFNSEKGVKLKTAIFAPDKLIIDGSRAEFCHNNVYDFQKNILDKYYPLDPKEKPEQAKLDAKSSFYGFLYDTYYFLAPQFHRL